MKPLAKSVLIPLGLTTTVSGINQSYTLKNILESAMKTLLILNEEMDGNMKIVKFLEKSGILIKGVNETIKNDANKQKGKLLRMLLGTLGAILG